MDHDDAHAPTDRADSVVARLHRVSSAAEEPAAWARRLTQEIPADALAEALLEDPSLLGPTLEPLATAWMNGSVVALEDYLLAMQRAAAAWLARNGPTWSVEELDLLLTLQLVHPRRFIEEDDFRARVTTILPRAFDPALPKTLRDGLLGELNTIQCVDFELSELVEVGWGASIRATASREQKTSLGVSIGSSAPIEATLLSLPSSFLGPADAERCLAGLESLVPRRDLLVLTDGPVRAALQAGQRGPRTHLLDTYNRQYTPWPRDPMLFSRRADGGVLVIQRPNLQSGREDDRFMGRELIQQIPAEIDVRWGTARWTMARIPFHNGQILLTPEEVWISLHSLEDRILDRLGMDRVPVGSFATAAGVERYLSAARSAADELTALFGRPHRFVHPLPEEGSPAVRQESMARLGGGAGFDLDSLLTLLPAGAGKRPTALVADVDAGADLLGTLPIADRERWTATYRLRGPVEVAVSTTLEHAASTRSRRLDQFLETVAQHLGQLGWRVDRLPLLPVPRALLGRDETDGRPAASEARLPDFLITWNNVVLEEATGGRRAEGFGSGIPTGDEMARRAFADAGYALDLLPILADSVINNGGYRCASNHLRVTPAP